MRIWNSGASKAGRAACLFAGMIAATGLALNSGAQAAAGPAGAPPLAKPAAQPGNEIYFAGGCFWGVEEYFSRIAGVLDAVSGYANGTKDNPTYREVCTGRTGHAETVRVRYDPDSVTLQTLARQFFKIINPLSKNRQGNDIGTQYRTGMYYVVESDRAVLAGVMAEVQARYKQPLAVELQPLTAFWPAEDYHQDYLKKNPGGYCHIDFSSLEDLEKPAPGAKPAASLDPARYSKPAETDLRRMLSAQEYDVTQNAGTERAFTGRFWNTKERGLYVDIVTGEPLFVSSDKFDSGSGWPSFTRPIDPGVVVQSTDRSYGMVRSEVRSRVGNSHLGHVFNDGPRDRGGMRYCINSASLRFVPYEDMEREGYGDLKHLVK